MKRTVHAMKNLLLICSCFAIVNAFAQDTKQATMEKRARELHRVIGLNDKEAWKMFMEGNYTKSFLERPVKTNVTTTEQESSRSTSVASTAGNMEEKLKIFERLHQNFADSKITSLKPVDERIEMIIENASHMKGTFSIAFENKKPYLIDGIRAEMDQR